MTRAFVGLQPIFDRTLAVYGYELLFRSADGGGAYGVDGELATSQVLVNTFMEIGLDRVVGHHLAFVNLTRGFLVDTSPFPFPADRMVLEILEDVEVDDALIEAVGGLRDQGFTIAIDDFAYHPRWEPLLALADIVKIDVQALTRDEVGEHVDMLRRYQLRLLAEKVETRDEYKAFRDMGFDYFQGYFLSRPTVISGAQIPSNRLASLQLLATLQNPGADMDAIEPLVSRDVALSYRLLKYLNSAYVGLPRPVDSIRGAVVYVGLDRLKRWASLVTLAQAGEGAGELTRLALVRARMCEMLCRERCTIEPETCFATGLLSALDALLDMPMSAILEHMPLSDEMRGALLAGDGCMGQALRCTLAYERWQLSEVCFLDMDPDLIRGTYTDAVAWSFEEGAELGIT